MGHTKRYIVWIYGIPDEDGLIPVWDKMQKKWDRIPLIKLQECTFVKFMKTAIAKQLGVKERDVKLPYREYTENYREALNKALGKITQKVGIR